MQSLSGQIPRRSRMGSGGGRNTNTNKGQLRCAGSSVGLAAHITVEVETSIAREVGMGAVEGINFS